MKKEFNLKNYPTVSVKTVEVLDELRSIINTLEPKSVEQAKEQVQYIIALSVAIEMLKPKPNPLSSSCFTVN